MLRVEHAVRQSVLDRVLLFETGADGFGELRVLCRQALLGDLDVETRAYRSQTFLFDLLHDALKIRVWF